MNVRKTLRIIVFVILLYSSHLTYALDVFVVANVPNLTQKTLTYSQIEDIFTFRNKRWNDGTPIKVFLLPRDDRRTWEFTIKYLNMTPNRYFDFIESRESSGQGSIISRINDEHDVMLKVLTTPGSIGYASDSIIINIGSALLIVK